MERCNVIQDVFWTTDDGREEEDAARSKMIEEVVRSPGLCLFFHFNDLLLTPQHRLPPRLPLSPILSMDPL